METRRPGSPPVIDMTPEGQFRDPLPAAGGSWLDRALGRVGGVALLTALVAGGIALAAVAMLFLSLLLPIVLGAGAVAFASLWWRARRMRASGAGPGAVRFMVLRR